jgi:hypothetical protein
MRRAAACFGDPLWLLLSVFGFLEFDSSVHVVMAKRQHSVDETGEHVCHGSYGFGGPEFGAPADGTWLPKRFDSGAETRSPGVTR